MQTVRSHKMITGSKNKALASAKRRKKGRKKRSTPPSRT